MGYVFRTDLYTITEGQLYHLHVMGLNIVAGVKAGFALRDDPRFQFMSALLRSYPSVVHLGGLALNDIEDEGEGVAAYYPDHFDTLISVHSGFFYTLDADDQETPRSYVLPHADVVFARDEAAFVNDTINYLLYCDAVALYVGESAPVEELRQRFSSTAQIDDRAWLVSTVTSCSFVVTTLSDGGSIDVYGEKASSFAPLFSLLEKLEEQFIQTDWYKQNQDKLTWGGLSARLSLPDEKTSCTG